MKSRAAVAFGPGQPLKLSRLTLRRRKKAKFWSKSLIPAFAIPMLLPFPAMIRKAYSRQSWVTKAAAW